MSRNILITGATSGIGLETAKYLYSHGERVFLIGRNEKKLKEISDDLGNSTCFVCDLEVTSSIKDIFKYFKEQNIKLDGMIHAAGYAINMPVRSYQVEHLDRQMKIHYGAFVELCKCFYNRSVSNDNSSIVAISSLASVTARKGSIMYTGSKSALNAAISVISKEFTKRHIRVNGIMPAYVDTPMTDGVEDLVDLNEVQPFGLIPPRSIAEILAFLLSDEAQYITGALIPISAGMEF